MEGEESRKEASLMSQVRKEGLSFTASLLEVWRHIQAVLTGQVKKAKARNEKEVSEADLQTAKTQVEATDAAENKKRQLEM